MKQLLKRLLIEEKGQGITEYALILGLVVLGIWIAIANTDIGTNINALFTKVSTTVSDCTAGASGPCSSAP
jgi:Flp pilus assembly pilin Flp